MSEYKDVLSRINARIDTERRQIERSERNIKSYLRERDELERQHKEDVARQEEIDRKRRENEISREKVVDPFAQIDVNELPDVPIPVVEIYNKHGMEGLSCVIKYECDHPYYAGLRFDFYVSGKHYNKEMDVRHADAHGTAILEREFYWEDGERATVFVRPLLQNKVDNKHYGNRYVGNSVGSDFKRLVIKDGVFNLSWEGKRDR